MLANRMNMLYAIIFVYISPSHDETKVAPTCFLMIHTDLYMQHWNTKERYVECLVLVHVHDYCPLQHVMLF